MVIHSYKDHNIICLITCIGHSTPQKILPFISCQIVHSALNAVAFQIFKERRCHLNWSSLASYFDTFKIAKGEIVNKYIIPAFICH